MFNELHQFFKKTLYLVLVMSAIYSCEKEIKIDFKEENIESTKNANISVNFPQAEGDDSVAALINTTIQNYIISQTNLSEDALTTLSINDAIKRFDSEFVKFRKDFPESAQKWEAFINGEVTYRSPEVFSIAINTYLDTGGAHGNTNIKLFNFNPRTGKLYSKTQLINDIDKLSEIIYSQLKKEVKSSSDDTTADFFYGKDFQLPESLGFSDEGLIVLYNPYEIASYSQGIIEFTIPFEDVESYLNIH